jgi:hypothetical protein
LLSLSRSTGWLLVRSDAPSRFPGRQLVPTPPRSAPALHLPYQETGGALMLAPPFPRISRRGIGREVRGPCRGETPRIDLWLIETASAISAMQQSSCIGNSSLLAIGFGLILDAVLRGALRRFPTRSFGLVSFVRAGAEVSASPRLVIMVEPKI